MDKHCINCIYDSNYERVYFCVDCVENKNKIYSCVDCVEDKGKVFAKQLFEAAQKYFQLEDALDILAEELVGDGNYQPFKTTIDYYDSSFELYEVPSDVRVHVMVLNKCWKLGFYKLWLNHTDGSETLYTKNGSLLGNHYNDPKKKSLSLLDKFMKKLRFK